MEKIMTWRLNYKTNSILFTRNLDKWKGYARIQPFVDHNYAINAKKS